MQNIPDNIDLLLPCGETLRGFMEQPFISPSDLKGTLRARGVFLNRNEKRDTIPVLVCCLLGPKEFDELRACQATHEDNPKTITRTIAWGSAKPLIEAIPSDLKLSDLVGEYVNYEVVGTPEFVPIGNNPNIISCEFEIEREDLSKHWAGTKSNFRGKLQIEKSPTGGSIKYVLTHTAGETKDLNRALVQHLTQHFKKTGNIGVDSEIETILFSSFNNEERISFFRSLTRGLDLMGFEFCGTTDFGICPDGDVQLPDDIRWMQDKVDDLKLNGRALEETFFIKKKEYHKFLLLYAMEAKFKFTLPTANGTCAVVFEFPDFATKKELNIEFEVNISSLGLAPGCSDVNRTAVKEELLRQINNFKLSQFEKHKTRPAALVVPIGCANAGGAVQLEAALDWGAGANSSPRMAN